MNNLVEENFPLNTGDDFIFEDTGGCISSLRHIPPGEVWPESDIQIRRKSLLESGREWLVVDNLIVHESIKQGTDDSDSYIQNYQQTLINLAESGIQAVCFNFMPVFYKIRTHFTTCYSDKHIFSLFDMVAFMAFDLFILKRKEAVHQYSSFQRHSAKCYFHKLGELEKAVLTDNILSAVQSDSRLTLEELKCKIERFRSLPDEKLSANLQAFRNKVVPFADSLGINMHLHTDNPCRGLFGLPSAS